MTRTVLWAETQRAPPLSMAITSQGKEPAKDGGVDASTFSGMGASGEEGSATSATSTVAASATGGVVVGVASAAGTLASGSSSAEPKLWSTLQAANRIEVSRSSLRFM